MRGRAVELFIVIVTVAVLGWFARPTPPAAVDTSPPSRSNASPAAPASRSDASPTTAAQLQTQWGPPRRTSAFTVHGTRPGMTRDEVHRILGKPPKGGALEVDNGRAGQWEEWGTPGTSCTWEGSPTVSYHADGTVLAVCGTKVEVESVSLKAGDASGVVAFNLGSALEVSQDPGYGAFVQSLATDGSIRTATYLDSAPHVRGQLVLTFADARLVRAVLSPHR